MDAAAARDYVEALYVEHRVDVYHHLYRMCRNTHLAEDLTAETFERALRALSQTDSEEHPTPMAWLRTIARNLLTDHWRRSARRVEVLMEEPIEIPMPAADDSPSDLTEALDHARQALALLTDGQRTAMVLRGVHDLNVVETAEAMGRTPQAVRSLQHKARRRIAEYRAQQGPVPDTVEAAEA